MKAPALYFPPMVAIEDRVGLTDAERQAATDLCEAWQNDRLSPTWGVFATMMAYAPNELIPKGAWPISLWEHETVAGAAGHHEVDEAAGIPIGIIDMSLQGWMQTLLHELGELLVDPRCTDCVLIGDRLYAREIADAVEEDVDPSDSRYINLVTADYFDPLCTDRPVDILGNLPGPLMPDHAPLTPGGYMSFLDITKMGDWDQVFGEKVPPEKRLLRAHTRRARRQRLHAARRSLIVSP